MSVPLLLLTFNCSKLKINSADFSKTLYEHLPDDPPHLFVFGFQEICSILDGSFSGSAQKHMIDINRAMLHALKTRYCSGTETEFNFTTIAIHHIGAIGIVAVTPYSLKFDMIRFAEASCGSALSLLKGAVGIRVRYRIQEHEYCEFTFANAHLCANEGDFYYQKRLLDIQTVMRAMVFCDGFSYLKPDCHTFFMGDLNFRTSKDPSATNTSLLDLQLASSSPDLAKTAVLCSPQRDGSHCHHEYISSLVKKYDELTSGREDGEVLSGFEEPCISFNPTYKYHLNTAIFNGKRSPLWCDRILYQATYKSQSAPTIHKYGSVPTYLHSDHRPVYLHLSIATDPPESIIAPNGYLIILPISSDSASERTYNHIDLRNSVSGPTRIYMKFTALDKLNQYYLRTFSDLIIGYSLWLGTSPKGRITLSIIFLMVWFWHFMGWL